MSEHKPKRDRGAGSILVRGHRVWLQYSDRPGHKVRESARMIDGRVLTTETENWQKKAEKVLRAKLGEAAAGIVKDSPSLKYEDIRAGYMNFSITQRRKALRRSKSGEIYLEAVGRLDNFFGERRVIDIDTDLLEKFQIDQQRMGLANGTINRAMSALRRMFALAARKGRLRNTPFFPMLPEAPARQGTLPQEKYTQLLAALPDYLRPIVTIGFRTGMRLGEILALRWPNVLWLDHIIRIPDSKNGEPREVPFSAELEVVLREQFAKRQEGCDRVCFRIDRKSHARPIGNFRKPWRRACVKIGLGQIEPVLNKDGQPAYEPKRYAHSKPKPKLHYVGLIFHDLRRTFITDAENSGASRHEVMKISGHKTESVYKRYAIENRERRRTVLAKIDEYRDQQVGHNSVTIEPDEKAVSSVTN